jgi:dipeptidyl-peptidase-4
MAGKYRFDIASSHSTIIGDAPEDTVGIRRGRGRHSQQQEQGSRGRGVGQLPARGRQFESAESPDGKLKAVYRDRNVWLTNLDGTGEIAVTTDGSQAERTKYGTASWVYGEELEQHTAMWWSPDGRKLAYYRFDEKQVPDYYLQMNQTDVYDTMDVEAYPSRASRIQSSICLSTTSSARGRRESTCGMGGRSTTTSSVITCTGSPGRRTVPKFC